MTASDLAFATIAEVAPRIEAGEISPVELTELALAYITVMADTARQASERAAAAIKAGQYLGPLHGIPVAVKDLFATSGVRTTFGSPLFADWVPDYDAAVVERLNAAGAIVLGKTNLHELAYGTTSSNAHYGAVRNPWHLECHPGGSSGGSGAAVADGLAMAALGSDTGASIRQPAACCGLVATAGRSPRSAPDAQRRGCCPDVASPGRTRRTRSHLCTPIDPGLSRKSHENYSWLQARGRSPILF